MWVTADVHSCAAHYYDPQKAQFQDFDRSGNLSPAPLNAGTFGPSALANTFGPQVIFQKTRPGPICLHLPACSFSDKWDIDARSAELTVSQKDIDGASVFTQKLRPSGS